MNKHILPAEHPPERQCASCRWFSHRAGNAYGFCEWQAPVAEDEIPHEGRHPLMRPAQGCAQHSNLQRQRQRIEVAGRVLSGMDLAELVQRVAEDQSEELIASFAVIASAFAEAVIRKCEEGPQEGEEQ